MELETRFMTLAIDSYGDATKPALVLVHGGYQSRLCWRKQVHALSEQAHVIALDLPWHGQTRVHQEGEHLSEAALCAQALKEVVLYYDLRRTGYSLVLWSYGARVGRNFLLLHGAQGLQGIVLVATTLANTPRAAARHTSERNASSASDTDRRLTAFADFFQALTAHPLSEEETYLTLGYNTQAFLQNRVPSPELVPGDITTITALIPLLLIQGTSDSIVSADFTQETFQQQSHGRIALFEGDGHSTMLENPGHFNEELLRFYEEVTHRDEEEVQNH